MFPNNQSRSKSVIEHLTEQPLSGGNTMSRAHVQFLVILNTIL